MTTQELKELLRETTVVLSKGEDTDVYLQALGVPRELCGLMFPAGTIPSSFKVIDCEFLSIGVHEGRAAARYWTFVDAVEELLRDNCLSQLFREGASYKHLTKVLGDDVTSLRLLCLGEALGIWNVLLPGDLAVPRCERGMAAALGMICMTGYPASIFFSEAAVG
jgi:hypothetical protein